MIIANRLRTLAAAAVVAIAAWGSAPAPLEAAVSVTLTQDEQAELQRIERYLDAIGTVRARFQQIASTGQTAEGTVTIHRPGRMRIDYDPPSPIEIVADGTWLIFHDRELEQVSQVPLSETPAAILLDPELSFKDDRLTVTDFQSDATTARVTILRTENPGEGRLTLVLSRNPLELRQWEVMDAQGTMTTVSLFDAEFGVDVDADLFRFRDPNFFGNGAFEDSDP